MSHLKEIKTPLYPLSILLCDYIANDNQVTYEIKGELQKMGAGGDSVRKPAYDQSSVAMEKQSSRGH